MGRKKGVRQKNSIYFILESLISTIEQIILEGYHTSTTIFRQLHLGGHLNPIYSQGFKSDSIRRAINTFIIDKDLIVKHTPSYAVKASRENTKWEEDYENGTASFDYSGLKKIQTEEDLIKFAKIDTTKWKAVKQTANKWGENYQIKVIFESVEKGAKEEEAYEQAKEILKKHLKGRKKISNKKKVSTKIGVIPLADFHIGAYIRGLIKTPDFDIDRISDMLDEIAEIVNSLEYSEVHIVILGDVIESFTGTNHPSTWKELMYKGHGSNIIIMAYELLLSFFKRITNLHSIYLVSGNHDRITSSKREDTKGEVIELIAYFLNKELETIIKYNSLLLTEVIDNICYIFTHGHHNFTKKSLEHIIWKYGKQGHFNLVLQGHWHTRKSKVPVINTETIYSDSGDYRGITCPSIFTGNYYSETAGFTSSAGFLIVQNQHNKPAVFDIPLN